MRTPKPIKDSTAKGSAKKGCTCIAIKKNGERCTHPCKEGTKKCGYHK